MFLNDDQLRSVEKCIQNNIDIFTTKFSCSNINENHKISTATETPIRSFPYRRSLAENKIIEDQVVKLLEQGKISKETSEWTSPALCVTKQNGDIRFCIDYWKLNKITVMQRFPLPHIQDAIDFLGVKKYLLYWTYPLAITKLKWTTCREKKQGLLLGLGYMSKM